jgi:hypothetical protein
VPKLNVQPRDTPAERPESALDVEVDDALAVHAAVLEDWVAPRTGWELSLRQGHDFDRPNNVEARILFAAGEQTSSLTFRLDQLDVAEDTAEQLFLRFEEADGIAKVARLSATGLDVELFHILTYT